MSGHDFYSLGNGHIFAVISNSNISSISIYGGHSLFSLRMIDNAMKTFSYYHNSEASARHEITRSNGVHCATCTDMTPDGLPVFIKRFRSYVKLSYSIATPNGESPYFFSHYRTGNTVNDVLCIESPIEPGKMPVRALIALYGKAVFINENSSIIIHPGDSYIIAAVGYADLVPSFIEKAKKLIKNGFASTSHFFPKRTRILERCEEFINKKHGIINSESINIIRSFSNNLISHTASNGGIISDFLKPYNDFETSISAVQALMSLGMQESAHLSFSFLSQKYEHFGSLYPTESICGEFRLPGFSHASGVYPYFLDTAMELHKKFGYKPNSNVLCDMTEKTLDSVKNGQLSFGGNDHYIICKAFSEKNVMQGSSVATSAFISAADKLLSYDLNAHIFTNKIRVSLEKAMNVSRVLFKNNFIKDDFIYLNNPFMEVISRRYRFKYGLCERCGDDRSAKRWIEKNRNGNYLCPQCLEISPQLQEHDYTERYRSIYSTFSRYTSSFLSRYELLSYAQRQINKLEDNIFISSIDLYPFVFTSDICRMISFLSSINHSAKDKAYSFLMSLKDTQNRWSDYYNASLFPQEWSRSFHTKTMILLALSEYWTSKAH